VHRLHSAASRRVPPGAQGRSRVCRFPRGRDHHGATLHAVVDRPKATREEGTMTTAEGHPLGTPPLGALVVTLSFVALLVLGVTTTASATSSGANAKAALALVTEARDAMTAEGSVTAIGGGTTRIPGIGTAAVTESDYADSSSGSQMVRVTSGSPGSGAPPSATTLDLSGTVDIDADASFWSSSMGVADAQAIQLANRWVQISGTSPIYGLAAADLTMPSLTQDLFDARSFHEGRTQTVDGVRTVAITYRNTGNDAGPVTCYVGLGGSHLPVAVTIGGLTLQLSAWGKVRDLAAPTGVIPLPVLTTANTSSTAGVA